MADLSTDVLVVGSGAGGAFTAAALAEAGRAVMVLEEGPLGRPRRPRAVLARRDGRQVPPPRGRRRRSATPSSPTPRGAAWGAAPRSTAGSTTGSPTTSPPSGRPATPSTSSRAAALDGYADRVEAQLSRGHRAGRARRRRRPRSSGAPPSWGGATSSSPGCSATTPRGGAPSRRCRAPCCPGRSPPGATLVPDCRVLGLVRRGDRVVGARCRRTHPGGGRRAADRRTPSTSSCAAAPCTRPALLQRSGIWRNIGNGLKMHPTIKIAARFPHPVDHGDVPMHRVTEFSPFIAIGGSASRKGQVALALADTGAPYDDAMADWENISAYYAAIRSEGCGRVLAVRGPARARRHLLAHRRRPQPAGPGARAPGRAAAGRGRHRAAPVGGRAARWCAGSTRSAAGGTR